jgi:hypothetical protein
MNAQEFDAVVAPIKALLEKKAQDYGSDQTSVHNYFPFGDQSYVQMLHIKTARLVALTSSNRPANFESRKDTVVDLINYAVFYLDYLNRSTK